MPANGDNLVRPGSRLRGLGIELPEPPTPLGAYVESSEGPVSWEHARRGRPTPPGGSPSSFREQEIRTSVEPAGARSRPSPNSMVRDAGTGKYRLARLFVLTLGFSRKSVRMLVFRSSTKVWAELHEKAFRRLGAVPKVVVLDNLLEGVLRPDVYDPALNPLYRDCLAHYSVVALPCRVGDPDRRGKVESAMGHIQRTPLKGLRFESLQEAQLYLDRWEAHWADTRFRARVTREAIPLKRTRLMLHDRSGESRGALGGRKQPGGKRQQRNETPGSTASARPPIL